MQNECTFVILGATGDLTKRKLIPAIYKLVADGIVSKFAIVGAALSNVIVEQVLAEGRKFIPYVDEGVWKKIEDAAYYHQMDFHDDSAYAPFYELLQRIEQKHGLFGNRIYYLAVLPQHFAFLTKNLAQCCIVRQRDDQGNEPWSRIVYEKPFGYDLQSAQEINDSIAQVYDEKQVYRIDHYLGKELVSNIALVRFTNRIFEPLWNNEHIDSVQIVLSEKIGIEGRGQFYDACGALKDVVQNHMLQILALVAMEPPEMLTAKQVRDGKAHVLENVKVHDAILGQYDGYLNEPNVNPDSQTETFAALKVTVENERWQGVPFYLKTGKNLKNKGASIHIKFKMVKCLLDWCPSESNYLTIKIQPNEGIYLDLNVKKPGLNNEVTPVTMDLCHSSIFGPNTPEAYETLLADVIKGDQCAFVRSDEIILSWKIIEQVQQLERKLYSYRKGTDGPKELKQLDEERDITWKA